MNEKVMEGIRAHMQDLSGFDGIELLEIEPGHSLFKIEVKEPMLNPFTAGLSTPFVIWCPA